VTQSEEESKKFLSSGHKNEEGKNDEGYDVEIPCEDMYTVSFARCRREEGGWHEAIFCFFCFVF
jgi:hypothetical protein